MNSVFLLLSGMLVVARGELITFIHDARPSETMAHLHVATITVQRINMSSNLPLETMAPLDVDTLTVQRINMRLYLAVSTLPWFHFMWPHHSIVVRATYHLGLYSTSKMIMIHMKH